MADESYDVMVIGTSQGGRFLPIDLAKAGRKVALVERGHLGGVCVNSGCTPTKTMVASARAAHQARRGAEYGVRTGPVSVDLAAVRERKRAMVAGARENYASRLPQDGLDLVEGEARFTGPKTVEIALPDGGTREIGAPVIVIDTGTRPRQLTISGAQSVPVLDSTSIMELGELPDHLIILGGGYIGLEFGQMFRRFGSEVTIVQTGSRLLTREDDDVSDEVATLLRDDGITVLTSARPERVEETGGGRVRLTVRTTDGERQVEGSGRVGMTERQAAEQNRSVRVAKLPMSAVIRALETGETRGFMKAVIDADTQQILGAAVLGVEGGEIMTIIQVAMLGQLPYTAMANAVFTHPLLAEGLNSLFMSLDAQ
ncbi:FAD-dependent oxidoreductase [Streptomyces sp. NPDC020125]|uniref:FAD-dependent oxidoreductase n=1 Tax=Streptomyces sp. NPDC020125 TaxID=3154593 RepID=UPI0033CDE785